MDRRQTQRWTAIALGVCVAAAARLRSSRFGIGWGIGGFAHLLVHVCLFGLLTGLLVTSTRSSRRRWIYFAAVVLLGIGTEFQEHLRDGYPIEMGDVLADALGAAVALSLSNAWREVFRSRREG